MPSSVLRELPIELQRVMQIIEMLKPPHLALPTEVSARLAGMSNAVYVLA
jgi:hypothetical protein